MSFTKSITALFMAGAFLSTAVHASPLAPRANVCDAKPTATTNLAQPISSPSVAKAADCQAACEAVSSCQCFVFGLPQGQSAPRCVLYPVPAAKAPAQSDDNLVVFDKACTAVPTGTPTASDPVGKKSNENSNQAQEKSNGNSNQTQQKSNGNSNQTQRKNSRNSDQTQQKSNGNPGQTQQKSNGNPGQTQQKSNGNPGQTQQKSNGNSDQAQQKSTNVCGAAPSGPSTSNPSPLHTDATITSKEACLQLGKQTSGCKSVEFGKPSSNGQQECRLFKVAASSLPAPGNGQTFVAYDIGC